MVRMVITSWGHQPPQDLSTLPLNNAVDARLMKGNLELIALFLIVSNKTPNC
jgi:hypothetical protein